MSISIGMISFAHTHAMSYADCLNKHPEAQIAWIYDPDKDRAQLAESTFNAPMLTDLNDIADTDCQGVIICSENCYHLEHTRIAAAAGKHVLCEKPLATNKNDADRMIDVCAQHGVRLMTAFPCRFHPAFLELKKVVDSGKIGEIIGVKATNQSTCPWGWFVDRKLSGGGSLIDHTDYVLDMIRVLTGQEVRSVYAEISNGMHKGDFEDTGIVNIALTNGVFATIDCSWSRPKTSPTWGNVKLDVTGTKGVCGVDLVNQKVEVFSDIQNRYYHEYWGDNTDYLMISSFVERCASGEPFLVTGEDGAKTVEVVEAAYRSSESAEAVYLR